MKSSPALESDWQEREEVGNRFWLRVGTAFYRLFGRRLTGWLLYPIAAYFFLAASGVRRASRNYLDALYQTPQGAAALGKAPTWGDVYRHILSFARSIADRVGVGLGDREAFHFDYRGDEHLRELVAKRRGAILLGSHLGSFDMLRTLASQNDVKINIVMYTRHAERINALFRRLESGFDIDVIEVGSKPFSSVFAIRDCLERGELVGILGDRTFPGAPDREAWGPRTARGRR